MRKFIGLFNVAVSSIAIIVFVYFVPESSPWANCAKFGAIFLWAWFNRLEDSIEAAK